MIIHLADYPSEIAATVDKETGNVIYSITLNSDDEVVKEDGGSNSFCGWEWGLRLLSQFCLL